MQNNPFILFLSGLVANVTEEQLQTASAALKAAGPEYAGIGTLDLELQKLWVAIQNLGNEAKADQDKASKEAKIAQAVSAKEFFCASLRTQVGWEKEKIGIFQGWQVMEQKSKSNLCPRCGVDHSLALDGIEVISVDLGGLGGRVQPGLFDRLFRR